MFWFYCAIGVLICPESRQIEIHGTALDAARDAHALVICTEWDEFKTLDYSAAYKVMQKPAFVFDGRLILDHAHLSKIGFTVHAIGKKVDARSASFCAFGA